MATLPTILERGTTIWPEKTYTQNEVDQLLALKAETPSLQSQAANTEAVVDTVDKQKILDDITVTDLVKKSNRILVSVYSVFPFDFIPDIINVEEGRVSIIKRHLLSSAVHSVDIKDISNVFINHSIFFSQLEIVSRTFEDNEVKIRFLKNKDAVYIRRIIEGLRIFENKQINTSDYSVQELVAKLEELSKTEIVT
jgi:hypothetical protein